MIKARPRKLLFCAYDNADGKIGGPIAWALDFLPYLKQQGIDVHALILQYGSIRDSRLASFCNKHQISFDFLDGNTTVYIEEQAEWILRCCRRVVPNVVVLNLVLPAFFCATAFRKAGIQTIAVVHSDPNLDSFYADLTDCFLSGESSNIDVAVPVSRYIHDELKKKNVNIRCEVIPCGCRIPPNPRRTPNSPLRLIYSGRLEQFQKRIRETVTSLIRATESLNMTATISGGGPESEWVSENLEGIPTVEFIGQTPPSQIQEILKQHDAIILLSDFEGLPIALIEGMAAGLVPVGLESSPGHSDVITHNVNGLLAKDRGDDFIVQLLKLQDEENWRQLSAAARKSVEEHFSHNQLFPRWLSLLNELFDSKMDITKLPKSIRTSFRKDRFPDYPPNRPGILANTKKSIATAYTRLRIAIRPRTRIRKLLKQSLRIGKQA